MSFAKRLKEIRNERGYSQSKAALLCKVSRTYWGQLESGKYDATVTIVCKICRGFNLTPNDLIKCEGDEHD
jgi:DNA-binding XRE family transcriptional regulator